MTDEKNTFHFLDTDVFKTIKEDKVIQFRELGNKKFKVPHVESLSAELYTIITSLQQDLIKAEQKGDMGLIVDKTINIVYLALSQKNKVEKDELVKVPFKVLTGVMSWIMRPSESGEPFLEEGHGATTEEQASK